MESRRIITQLDQKHQELDALLERCKLVPIDPDLDVSLHLYCYDNFSQSLLYHSPVILVTFGSVLANSQAFDHHQLWISMPLSGLLCHPIAS